MPRLFPALLALGAAALASARDQTILLGTYTDTASRGIYAVRLNGDTGALSAPELVAALPDPEFLAADPGGHTLYALTRVKGPDGRPVAAVASFRVEADGRLAPLNTQPTGRGSLTHLAVDATGRMLVAASYGGGYVVSFPLEPDGRLGAAATILDQAGALGPVKDRQNAPHPHSVTLSPDNRLAWVADLGLDRVFAYRLDPTRGTIAPADPAAVVLAAGTGPRHTKFSPDGRFYYVLGELDATITACRYDAGRGVAEPFQRISLLPEGDTGRRSGSEIRIHPNGRFVYAANRFHNVIAVFARDPETGALTRIEVVPSGGEIPRNFSLSPDGAWLVCAHQDSGNLTVFKVDAATGRLTATPHTAQVARAVCVLFQP
ncbi:MAG TPA: lactonase family protein [Lacunisphaera sp.]|nr:lactonase family protein [Lacunisphaera sp.]